jgi:hypothetical protein
MSCGHRPSDTSSRLINARGKIVQRAEKSRSITSCGLPAALNITAAASRMRQTPDHRATPSVGSIGLD